MPCVLVVLLLCCLWSLSMPATTGCPAVVIAFIVIGIISSRSSVVSSGNNAWRVYDVCES